MKTTKKTKKANKGIISTQIFAMTLIGILLISIIVAAIVEKTPGMIIAAIVFTIEYVLMLLHEINIIKEAAGYKVKKNPIYMWLFILILIITFCVTSPILLINNIKIKSNSEEIQATIYKIDKKVEYETHHDDDGNTYETREEECRHYITYTVDNKQYKNQLSELKCKYLENDKVTIYYNKDNPSEIVEDHTIIGLVIGIFISYFALFAFFYSSIKDSKSFKKKQNKKENIE